MVDEFGRNQIVYQYACLKFQKKKKEEEEEKLEGKERKGQDSRRRRVEEGVRVMK